MQLARFVSLNIARDEGTMKGCVREAFIDGGD